MTIDGWIEFVLLGLVVAGLAIYVYTECDDNKVAKILTVLIAALLMVGIYAGLRWYFTNTASGQRALTDQQSELSNGLERTITVYTADGNIIAQYTGRIDIEGNDGGYVLFDYEGSRYTYYNCFVESIAAIE